MSNGITINGTTPGKGEEYTATLTFDQNARFSAVHLASNRGKGTYSVADLAAILGHLRQHKAPMALWNASGEAVTLEQFFQANRANLMCGCMADLLTRMGLVSIHDGLPVRISAK